MALDAERGWLLMRDGGERLRELVHSSRDLHHWEALLPEYAEVQLALAPHVGDLQAAGVPDERLARLSIHLAALLDNRDACLIGRDNGLTANEWERLDALLPEFSARCAGLAACRIRSTHSSSPCGRSSTGSSSRPAALTYSTFETRTWGRSRNTGRAPSSSRPPSSPTSPERPLAH